MFVHLNLLTPSVQIDIYHSFKCTGWGMTYILYVIHFVTFSVLIFLQQKIPQMFFIARHMNPENFKLTKRFLSYEIWHETTWL